jgi:hypothetical protein
MRPEPVEGRLPAYVQCALSPSKGPSCVRFDACGEKRPPYEPQVRTFGRLWRETYRQQRSRTHSAPSAERSCPCCFSTEPVYGPLIYSCGVSGDPVPGVAAAYAF